MNSLDPWRLIVTDPAGNVIVPTASYGHPFYREIPSWIHYDDDDTTTRQLFDGAFVAGWPDMGDDMTHNIGAELTALSPPGYGIYRPFRPYGVFYRPYGGVFFGAETPPPVRQGLTAEVGPILAPGSGGVTFKKELDDKQVLHVEVCVDGRCYRTAMDLAPAFALIMGKLSRWHETLHDGSAPPPHLSKPQVSGDYVVGCCDRAVAAAGDAMVGSLMDRHVATISSGFLSDIAGAVKSAASGVAKGVSSTFKKLKGPIATAAGIAAAAGAAAIPGVGPIAAPMAAKLANDIVKSAAGDSGAKKAVAQAAKEAKSDPAVAVALEQATKAVANSTAAHHVQDTAKAAARGDSAAQQQIVQVADDASKGDPAAKAVADLVANAMKSEWGAKLWEKATGRGPDTVSSGWYDIIGAGSPIDAVRDRAKALASAKRGNAAGVIHSTRDGHWHARGFASLDAAIDWLQRSTHDRTAFTYAAAFEKGADGTAYFQAEEFADVPRETAPTAPIRRDVAMTSGWYDLTGW